MKKYIFCFLTLCALILSSCEDFKEITFSGIENVKIISLSQQGVEAEITARIKNPNNMAFTIYKSDMDVSMSGIPAGKAHLSSNVRIKANSENSYTFKIKSDFSNISLTDMPKILAMAMSKNVNVGLKGNLKAGKFFMKKIFPVDITQRVPLKGL